MNEHESQARKNDLDPIEKDDEQSSDALFALNALDSSNLTLDGLNADG